MAIIKTHTLIENLFELNKSSQKDLWENIFLDDYSQNELIQLKNIKKKSLNSKVDFSDFCESKLQQVFLNYIHHTGFFKFIKDNTDEDYGYTSLSLWFNPEINMGYIHRLHVEDIICHNNLNELEELYELEVEEYEKDIKN